MVFGLLHLGGLILWPWGAHIMHLRSKPSIEECEGQHHKRHEGNIQLPLFAQQLGSNQIIVYEKEEKIDGKPTPDVEDFYPTKFRLRVDSDAQVADGQGHKKDEWPKNHIYNMLWGEP